MWLQKEFKLSAKARGFHLVTEDILGNVPEIRGIKVGLMHILIKHTSAALTLNENADPTVRQDFESYFSRAVPEGESYYLHNDEGDDDLPAHIKASLLGTSLSLPITNGRLNLGVWQGIYLCEHRNRASGRRIVVTLNGE